MAKHEKNGQYGQDFEKKGHEKQGTAKHGAPKEGQARWEEKQGKAGKHNGFGKTSREEEVGGEESRESSRSSKY